MSSGTLGIRAIAMCLGGSSRRLGGASRGSSQSCRRFDQINLDGRTLTASLNGVLRCGNCCCPPPGLEITTSLQSQPTAFELGSKMDSEGNKKRKLDNVGCQDVETVKAFDKPRAPLTATAGELKHPSQGLCHCKRSLPLFRQEKSSRCLMQ